MGKTFPKIKVAAAQLAPVFLDLEAAGHSARPDVVRLLWNPEGAEPLAHPGTEGGNPDRGGRSAPWTPSPGP